MPGGAGQPIGMGPNGPIYASAGGGGVMGSIPGASPTLPTPPNLTEIQANPQLQQVYNSIFGKVGTTDPLLEENLANIRARMSADTTGRAINRATGKIEDQLAGHLQANKERAARMGGGGGEAAGARKLASDAQRAEAAASADISLGRERDLDTLALGAFPSYLAPGQQQMGYLNAAGGAAQAVAGNQLGAAGQALQAWQAQQAAQAQQQQMALQQQMAMLQMYSNLWS